MKTVRIERFCYSPYITLGRIYVNDRFFFTVEKPWANNEPYISCIPEGTYICKRYESSRHGSTFEVTNVPNRTYILYHVGNTAKSVKGCIAVGKYLSPNFLSIKQSTVGLAEFLSELQHVDNFQLHVTQYQATYDCQDRA